MKTAQYLDAVKERLLLKSDYALAKSMGVSKQRISDWREDKHTPDAYACALIAVQLGIDPASVIADIHSQTEKDEKRREFWRGFLARASKSVAVVMLALSFTLICALAPPAGGRRRFACAA